MTIQHKNLAAGRWKEMTFAQQMSNIGSEVQRALTFKSKNNKEYSIRAFERSLELVDLTLDNAKGFPVLKEVARLRESLVDYFCYENQFKSSADIWQKYFLSFVYLARKNY